VLAGLVTVSLGLGGVAVLGLATEEAEASDDWRPTCARSLGPGYATLDVHTEIAPAEGRVVLFGIDRSPSNADQADAQLEAAAQYAGALPLGTSYGILFISDRSDRSSTPDLPIEPARPTRRAVADPLPCAPDCTPQTLFEQACMGKVEDALQLREAELARDLEAEAEAKAAVRAERLRSFAAGAHAYWPKPGTSLLRFWHKVADLPAVRRDPTKVTVVLMSDLEEALTRDRQAIRRFTRAQRRAAGECPTENPLPAALAGAHVVLLQTVTDRVNGDKWSSIWEDILGCAGVDVVRYRYSDAIPLADFIPGA
jgi:hypothetical protein